MCRGLPGRTGWDAVGVTRACRPLLAADKHAIPKVDNTNVDRSVATIHATLLGCLRRTARVRCLGCCC